MAGKFLGTDGQYHPEGSFLGVDGQYHYASSWFTSSPSFTA